MGYTDDIFAALDIQDELQTLYTSGTVFHAFLGEKLPNWKSAATLIRTIAENYKLPYYTLSPTYSVCKTHGYIAGEHYTCPECGEKTEVYSRITGYYRPVQNWNDGKAAEFKARKVYVQSKLTNKQPLSEYAPAEAPEAVTVCDEPAAPTQTILFTTATCPNCKAAGMFLDKAGVAYEKLIVGEESKDLVAKYGVKQAPTLVVVTGDEFETIPNLSNIKAYAEKK